VQQQNTAATARVAMHVSVVLLLLQQLLLLLPILLLQQFLM